MTAREFDRSLGRDFRTSSAQIQKKDGRAPPSIVNSPTGVLGAGRGSALSAFYVQLIHNLLNVGHAGGELFYLVAQAGSVNIALEGEHAVLGVIADVLFFQPMRDDYCLEVLFNRVIHVRVDLACRAFDSLRPHADLV